ncbi:SDR family NAD(P)-dependent oxidoreductase [Pseudomonas sp. A014]|uniref:SDR family NAD(P)-dependent oxidoreductase n=1 Tax=Pseudomonas sp. A014 TaxID=3458058 RepID=UPI0040353E8B
MSKVVIVTGAASGVGLESAKALYGKGFRVVLSDLDADGARQAAEQLDPHGEMAIGVAMDVTLVEAVQVVVGQVVQRWGQIDALVNNAGLPQENRPFDSLTDADWNRQFAVNVMGIVHTCQAVAQHMRERRQGRIVNVTSVAGSRARPGMSAYCAAKAAAVSLTQTLALELAEFGVTVNAVAPGSLETPMFAKFLQPGESWEAAMQRYLPQIPLHRLGSAQEIAETIAWMVADAPGFMTGQNLLVDGGRCL